jgi:hypothetical protein
MQIGSMRDTSAGLRAAADQHQSHQDMPAHRVGRTCSMAARVIPWEDMSWLALDHHQSKSAVCVTRGIRG